MANKETINDVLKMMGNYNVESTQEAPLPEGVQPLSEQRVANLLGSASDPAVAAVLECMKQKDMINEDTATHIAEVQTADSVDLINELMGKL